MADTKTTITKLYRYLLHQDFPKLINIENAVANQKNMLFMERLFVLFESEQYYNDYITNRKELSVKLNALINESSVIMLSYTQQDMQNESVYFIILINSKLSMQSIFFFFVINTNKYDQQTTIVLNDSGIYSRRTISQKISLYEFVPSYSKYILFTYFLKAPYKFIPSLEFLFPSQIKLKKTPLKKTSPKKPEISVVVNPNGDSMMDVQKFYQHIITKMKSKEDEIVEGSLYDLYFETIKQICRKEPVTRRSKGKTKSFFVDKIAQLMEEDNVMLLTGYEKHTIRNEEDKIVEELFPSSAFIIVVSSEGNNTPVVFMKERNSEYSRIRTGIFPKKRIMEMIEIMPVLQFPDKLTLLYFSKKQFKFCPALKNEKLKTDGEIVEVPKKKEDTPLLFNPDYDCMQRASYGRRNVYSKDDLVKIAMTLKLFTKKSEATKMEKSKLCEYIKSKL